MNLVAPTPTTKLIKVSLRPALEEGKGSGKLGPNSWACAEEFHTPIRSQLRHSHMISSQRECNIDRYSYTTVLTNRIQALHGPVGVHHSIRTEDSAKVHQSIFPPRGGWGRGMKLNYSVFVCAHVCTNHCTKRVNLKVYIQL